MINFSDQFQLISFAVVASLAFIMLVASIIMLFRLHKSHMNFFGVLTYGITWIIMVASLAVATVALINRTGLLQVEGLLKRIGGGVELFCNFVISALMMEIAIYALTVLTIAQLVIHPLVWAKKKEYATPVAPADGDGYIAVDEAFSHFDEATKAEEIVPTERKLDDEEIVSPLAYAPETITVEPIEQSPEQIDAFTEEEQEPTPVVEEPTPIAEEPTPVVEEPTPIVEEPTPIVEEPTPIVEEPTPIVEEPKVEVKTIARPSRTGSRIVARKSSEKSKRRVSKINDNASAVFEEYLKGKTEEEKEVIAQSIDRVVIDSKEAKKK